MSQELARLSRMRTLYDQGGVTKTEIAVSVVDAILKGEVKTFAECKPFLPPDTKDVFLTQIRTLESDGYIDKRTYVRSSLSEEEKIKRAQRFKHVYEKVFSQIEDFFQRNEDLSRR